MKTVLILITTFVMIGLLIPNVFGEDFTSPEWLKTVSTWWVTDRISDDEFVTAIEFLLDDKVIVLPETKIGNRSDLPNWLINNAGWWSARISTDSDFNFDPNYIKDEIYPCTEFSIDVGCFEKTYSSHGFRGNEFDKEKPGNMFRIFAVGGSTTYGSASNDDETWPAHLQKVIDVNISDKKIEVINAGVSGGNSKTELNLIKQIITKYNPDLVIMYDGWNDHSSIPVNDTIENWESVCKLGMDNDFDVIIAVQPVTITGQRVLTNQEITNTFSNFSYIKKSNQYIDSFDKLNEICTSTVDLRHIFDYIQKPIFWDYGHTVSVGNKIIAENIFSTISPIYFGKVYDISNIFDHDNNKPITVYAVGADLSGKNFDNLNLQDAVFDWANLSNTSFKNTNIDGARFTFANISNSNLLEQTNLTNINLAGTDISDINLKGKDLSGANLSYVDLSEHDLTDTNLVDSILSHAKFSDINLKGKDLSGANLSYVDLSEHDLTDINLSNTFLFRTDLSGKDLREVTLTNSDFRYSFLNDCKLPDQILVDNDLSHANLDNINFSGKDLSYSTFQQTSFNGSDLQNTDLTAAEFVQVDFTEIKNKSLAGATIIRTSFAYSDLRGIDVTDLDFDYTNFKDANLSGLDLTSNNFFATIFDSANLANSNLSGVDLSPKDAVFVKVFHDKASMIDMSTSELFSLIGAPNITILSKSVNGNDLTIEFFTFTDFRNANLQDADLQGTNLQTTYFRNANLSGANLEGADLSYANLSGANLDGADLSGVNLEGAHLSGVNLEGAHLNCMNHPICLNE